MISIIGYNDFLGVSSILLIFLLIGYLTAKDFFRSTKVKK